MIGKNNLKNNRICNIRAFAIFLVVLAHSIIIYNPYWKIYSSSTNSIILKYLCITIYIFHMPLFFAISGFLFDKSFKKEKKYSSFVLKKIKRLIVPYFFIFFFWLLPLKLMVGYKNYVRETLINNIIQNFVLGKDNGHLWFLLSLFIIFLLYYILYKNIKNKKNLFLICVTLSFAGYFVPSYVGKALQNIIWFSFGNMLNIYENDIKKEKKYKILLCFCIVVYLIFYGRLKYYKYLCLILKYIICLYIIPIIIKEFPEKENILLEKISESSFGIYLFHSPLIYITYSSQIVKYPYMVLFINFVGYGILSYFITCIIKKSKLKFIIGE